MAAVVFMETVAFTAMALRTTVLYRTDHSVLGVGFVMIMTASSVIILYSAIPGPGITTRPDPTITTIPTTTMPLPVTVT